jgi:hypothetical protein
LIRSSERRWVLHALAVLAHRQDTPHGPAAGSSRALSPDPEVVHVSLTDPEEVRGQCT